MIKTVCAKTVICPVCGEELINIDDMNYSTSICPKCFSTVFEETNGEIHTIRNGKDNKNYNVSMDIFLKQLLSHNMSLMGKFGIVNVGDILLYKTLSTNIYDNRIFDHFYPMIKDFKMKQRYIYFDGYEKYLKSSDMYYRSTFPELF